MRAGEYVVQVTASGFKIASQAITLRARDRAVLSAALSLGETTETVEVTAEASVVQTMSAAGVIGGVPGGVPGGQMGGVIGGIVPMRIRELPPEGRNVTDLMALNKGAVNGAMLAKEDSGSSAPQVRSYFPESRYTNPEIITDTDGRASIVIPMADSITTWHMAMIASTKHGALGTSTSSLKVFQDFFVDLDLPVTLTQGDRVSIPVAIYNYSDSGGDVGLHLEPEDWFSLVEDVADKSVALNSAASEVPSLPSKPGELASSSSHLRRA